MGKKRVLQILVPCIILAAIVGIYLIKNPPVSEPENRNTEETATLEGVAPGVMIALILGRAGASIPEVSLLGSIFKKKMVIAFVLCIFAVAVVTGYAFNFIL